MSETERSCPECSSPMRSIMIIDRSRYELRALDAVLTYADPNSEPGFWTGSIKSEGIVDAIACTNCGRILLYARPKLRTGVTVLVSVVGNVFSTFLTEPPNHGETEWITTSRSEQTFLHLLWVVRYSTRQRMRCFHNSIAARHSVSFLTVRGKAIRTWGC